MRPSPFWSPASARSQPRFSPSASLALPELVAALGRARHDDAVPGAADGRERRGDDHVRQAVAGEVRDEHHPVAEHPAGKLAVPRAQPFAGRAGPDGGVAVLLGLLRELPARAGGDVRDGRHRRRRAARRNGSRARRSGRRRRSGGRRTSRSRASSTKPRRRERVRQERIGRRAAARIVERARRRHRSAGDARWLTGSSRPSLVGEVALLTPVCSVPSVPVPLLRSTCCRATPCAPSRTPSWERADVVLALLQRRLRVVDRPERRDRVVRRCPSARRDRPRPRRSAARRTCTHACRGNSCCRRCWRPAGRASGCS